MSQVTIYLDADAVARAKASAAASQLSLSAWIAKLVKEQVPPMDARGYPTGFFEAAANRAPQWHDFPDVSDLRATNTPDLPRESW